MRRSFAPVDTLIDLQDHRAPIDLLAVSGDRDAELTADLLPVALDQAESVILVLDGRVRVAFDRRPVRGNVLATSAPRHVGETIPVDEPILDLSGPVAVGIGWLARWSPVSLVSLPLEARRGVLLAMNYRREFDTEAVAALRSATQRVSLRLALREAQDQVRLTRLALDANPVPTAGLQDGRIAVWNAAAERTYGLPRDEVQGQRLSDVVRTEPDSEDLAWQESAHLPITPVRIDSCRDGELTGVAFTDRSDQVAADEALALQQSLSVMLLESVPGRACVLDTDGIVVATNAAFDAQGPLGRGRRSTLAPGSDYLSWLAGIDEELQRRLQDVLDGDLRSVTREIESTYRRRQTWTEIHATSARHPNAAALILHLDITERKETELDLHHKATHDALTGLPNRVLLVDRLTHALTRAARSHANVGVVYCDLDRFKEVNTAYGHSGGDQLLVQVGRRLRAACRTSDTVARVSGDEFVVLLEDVTAREEVEEVARRILTSLAVPVQLDDGVAHTGASLGLALTPGIARAGMGSVQKLVRQVDAAMYAAKGAGRNQYAWFSPEMLEQPQTRPNFLEVMARRLLNR
jgi:diguanylate cyclase (GGDEF)-like protein